MHQQEIQESDHYHSSKKRKMDEKVVVKVKIDASDKKQQKNEGPPADCWSWRKYGQKPIKGSPHPRGYYRCSTSKGCSAKKQVERSKSDASMLIVTYTSSHNHPGPDSHLDPKQLPHTDIPIPEDDNDVQHCSQESNVEASQIANSSHSDQPKLQMEEYDFYDELEELPIPSFFTSFITNSLCEETVIVNPS